MAGPAYNINLYQSIIYPLSNPRHPTGPMVILTGNLAPDGAVAKIAGMNRLAITGPAMVFDSEEDTLMAILKGKVKNAGASIAHIGFALLLIGALISTLKKLLFQKILLKKVFLLSVKSLTTKKVFCLR